MEMVEELGCQSLDCLVLVVIINPAFVVGVQDIASIKSVAAARQAPADGKHLVSIPLTALHRANKPPSQIASMGSHEQEPNTSTKNIGPKVPRCWYRFQGQ